MFSVSKSLFVLIFVYVSPYLQEIYPKMNAEVFERRNAEETTYGAYDGPSCL